MPSSRVHVVRFKVTPGTSGAASRFLPATERRFRNAVCVCHCHLATVTQARAQPQPPVQEEQRFNTARRIYPKAPSPPGSGGQNPIATGRDTLGRTTAGRVPRGWLRGGSGSPCGTQGGHGGGHGGHSPLLSCCPKAAGGGRQSQRSCRNWLRHSRRPRLAPSRMAGTSSGFSLHSSCCRGLSGGLGHPVFSGPPAAAMPSHLRDQPHKPPGQPRGPADTRGRGAPSRAPLLTSRCRRRRRGRGRAAAPPAAGTVRGGPRAPWPEHRASPSPPLSAPLRSSPLRAAGTEETAASGGPLLGSAPRGGRPGRRRALPRRTGGRLGKHGQSFIPGKVRKLPLVASFPPPGRPRLGLPRPRIGRLGGPGRAGAGRESEGCGAPRKRPASAPHPGQAGGCCPEPLGGCPEPPDGDASSSGL